MQKQDKSSCRYYFTVGCQFNMYMIQIKLCYKGVLSGITALLVRKKSPCINVYFQYFGKLNGLITEQLWYRLRTVN